ncbi:GNAT family N-acetyltransferase [Lentzea sp. BCCO 10_0856]|uniref:GNAT family N-acetyltransferase n=1 Tax=Lentzea miocenica TaxID=3095431 RepID=A0ABU4TET6_9PSEU|nr:GNAT family N-acetyltransferase [Lentzea sp. BCCO 10_0856]MDX8036387.1 GNAT family N-acetyltransferase [Lentzea sp. BCCO 10_0856]
MAVQQVTLRKMTIAEYRSATDHREAESVRVLSRTMPEQVALERVRSGTTRFLPDGLGTAGHHLLTAENELGEAVGNAWIGPDPGQVTGTASSAWLYDINVFPTHRRLGYGSAILTAAEALIAREGMTVLGLNVVGDKRGGDRPVSPVRPRSPGRRAPAGRT